MLDTHKLSSPKDVVAVAFAPEEIRLRKSGKQFFGTEEMLCRVRNGTLEVDVDVARTYGINVCNVNNIHKGEER